MKKVVLSITAAAALSSFAIAGGDIAPTPVAEPDNSGFYFGLGYSFAKTTASKSIDLLQGELDIDAELEHKYNAGLVLVGYQYNEYIGVEGRFTSNFSEYDLDFSVNSYNGHINDLIGTKTNNIAVYLKPQYTFGNVTAYGLLGYGWTKVEGELLDHEVSDTHGAFQWGLGASFALSEHTSIFADYVHVSEETFTFEALGLSTDVDIKSDYFNVGMTYKF